MFRPIQPASPRQGVILLVVLSMLLLFSIVGVSFVIYANSEANTNRATKDAPAVPTTDMDPEQIGAYALGQIIYDVPDDLRGAYSALRGHSLARNMYGYNDAAPATNDTPYSGPGRFNILSMFPTSAVPLANNEAFLLNYTYFASADPTLPMRDPEHFPSRPVNNNPNVTPDQYTNTMSSRGTYTAQNPSYTYADHNSLFLAAVKADGTLLSPSFHRNAIFGSLDPNQNNPNWSNQEGRYLTLRPRPIDMGPGFPYPVDAGGDVKNLVWAPGGCDSIWIDINAPIMTAADGRRYKMLVAPLIMDLDNRLNVNACGNIMGATNPSTPNSAHNGNQMWGPWEMNLSKVLNSPNAPSEWTQLFTGKPNPATGQYPAVVAGKYGTAYGTPNFINQVVASPFGAFVPHLSFPVDYNGGPDAGGVNAVPFQIPGYTSSDGSVNAPSFQPWPSFPVTFSNANNTEMTNNANMYNPYRPTPGFANNRVLAASDMHALLRRKDSGSEAITSTIERLLPINLSLNDPSAVRRRMMLTVSSWDLDRPAMTPYVWDPQNQAGTNPTTQYQLVYNVANYPAQFPVGNPTTIAFPSVNNATRTATPTVSEFDPNTWRSIIAKLGRIDLNRPLTAYDPTQPVVFHQAELDRQNLAKDIFNRLCLVTGANSPFITGVQMVPVPPANATYDPNFEASRYLAQLAANMVDYIDNDDYNTIFVWNPLDPTVADPWNDPNPKNNNFLAANIRSQLVFGTEPPKLLLNEAYLQYDNDIADPGIFPNLPANRKATGKSDINAWVELVNPSILDPNYDNTAYLVNQNKTDPNFGKPIYQILLCTPPPNLAAEPYLTPDNVLGDPIPNGAGTMIINNLLGGTAAMDFGNTAATQQVAPLNGNYSGTAGGNQGFYVLGPNAAYLETQPDPKGPDPNIKNFPQNPNLPFTYLSSSMTCQVATPVGAANVAPLPKQMILLRRLVYPSQPANPATAGGAYVPGTPYNPYITVDYLDAVTAMDSRIYTTTGSNVKVPGGGYKAMTKRNTVGRKQPYDSNTALVAQIWNPAPAALPNTPQNTFFYQNMVEDSTGQNPPANGTTSKSLTLPFNWLTHLDRQLISPVELLQMSGHKPHELTHTFVQPVNGVQTPYMQGAPWLNQTSRLYRFFEMIETQSKLPGAFVGGRIPGKININTLWDAEPFLGAVDAQPGNTFYGPAGNTDAYAQQIFNQMLLYRTPNYNNANPKRPPIDVFDKPFKSLGTTYAAGGDALDPGPFAGAGNTARGINDTILGSPLGQNLFNPTVPLGGATSQPTFVPPVPNVTHPYQQMEMLNKLYNNVTTHSNTFAVFLTIGFFEVTNDQTRPVQLGPEINAAQGTNVRHRVFAIVDRTNLEVFASPVLLNATIDTQTAGSYPYEVQLDGLVAGTKTTFVAPLNGINPNTTNTWQIQSGSVLVIDPNTANEETVTVYNKAGANLFAMFRRPHLAGASVISRGNPGPWIRYNPRADTNVVPFYAVID